MQRTWRRLRLGGIFKKWKKRKSQPKWTDGPTPLLSLLTKRQSCRCFETILADSWLATRLYWFKTRCFVFFSPCQGPDSRGWNLCLIFPPRSSPNQTPLISGAGYLRAPLKPEESICQLLSKKICDFQDSEFKHFQISFQFRKELCQKYINILEKPHPSQRPRELEADPC